MIEGLAVKTQNSKKDFFFLKNKDDVVDLYCQISRTVASSPRIPFLAYFLFSMGHEAF